MESELVSAVLLQLQLALSIPVAHIHTPVGDKD